MLGRTTFSLLLVGIALVSGCGKQSDQSSATPTVDAPRESPQPATPVAVPAQSLDKPADKPVGDQISRQAPETPAEVETKTPPSPKEMLKRAENGVVVVEVFDALDARIGFGSGCLIGKGLVLTNFHVIADAVTAKVQAKGAGDELLGTAQSVLGYRVLDQQNDLAVLAVDGLPEAMQVLPLADASAIEQYDKVFAIGHPDGIKFSTTPGFVNSLVKTGDLPEQLQASLRGAETEWIQTDAVIAGGSSGGPLLNERGEIVGINTMQVGNRIGLAVRVQHVQDLLKKLATQTSPFPVPDADVLTTKLVAEMKQGYEREYHQFVTDLQQARAAGDPKKLQELFRRNNPGPACIQRCLELVKSHKGQREADDAVRMSAKILQTSSGNPNSGRHYLDRVLKQISADPRTIQSPGAVVRSLSGISYSPELELFLRSVIASDAEASVKGAAGVVLVTAMLAAQDEAMNAEMLELATSTRDNYGDLPFRGTTLREFLEPLLNSFAFSIGKEAPDIQGKDFDGKEFRLSDFRGKIVVLDFWADWCPHCRNMYQHEREMVERLKDQPFVLLGVNGDEAARAKRVIAAGDVTWRSWQDGPGGPITTQYRIESWPTVFILDKEGRIRFKDVRGEEMESAVNKLLGDASHLDGPAVVPANAMWRFQTASEDVDETTWKETGFDDSQWKSGAGPFGNEFETTRLEQLPAGQRPLTTLFRTRFDAPEGKLPEHLLMKLRFRDGIAISLNGSEIYRSRLPRSSTFGSAAIDRARNMEEDGVLVIVPTNQLNSKGNTLAVEVHRFSKYATRSLFELALVTPPVLSDLMDGPTTAAQQAEICQLLTDVGGLPGAAEILKKMQSTSVPDLQLRAAIASALYEQPIVLKKRSDPAIAQSLAQTIMVLNLSAWKTVQRDDLTEGEYLAGLRLARGAYALLPLVHTQLKPLTEGVSNTYAVALIRSGQYEAAITTLNKSIKSRGENPMDVAYLCLAQKRLGMTSEAEQSRDQLTKLMEIDSWRHNGEAQNARQEVDRAFDGAATAP